MRELKMTSHIIEIFSPWLGPRTTTFPVWGIFDFGKMFFSLRSNRHTQILGYNKQSAVVLYCVAYTQSVNSILWAVAMPYAINRLHSLSYHMNSDSQCGSAVNIVWFRFTIPSMSENTLILQIK